MECCLCNKKLGFFEKKYEIEPIKKISCYSCYEKYYKEKGHIKVDNRWISKKDFKKIKVNEVRKTLLKKLEIKENKIKILKEVIRINLDKEEYYKNSTESMILEEIFLNSDGTIYEEIFQFEILEISTNFNGMILHLKEFKKLDLLNIFNL